MSRTKNGQPRVPTRRVERVAPGIQSLPPDEISRFLLRKRWADPEQLEIHLDVFLREILIKSNEFVPSEAGCIFLDDPRAKRLETAENTLTIITSFGPGARLRLGTQVPCDEGIAGRVYATGRPHVSNDVSRDAHYVAEVDRPGFRPASLVAVPIIVGNSICGVLVLFDRKDAGGYTPRDLELLQIFAGYLSSSIQNALDAIRGKELSRRDDLTGLFNDRFFHVRLREEIARADAEQTALSLVVIDIDHFKRVNDTYNHLAGSQTLREAGTLLRDNIPPGGIAARYGGDEFVVILPGADSRKAVQAAEALRREFAGATFLTQATPGGPPAINLRGLTASLGVASLHEHVEIVGSVEARQNTLFRLADKAMYEAKSQGRNTVCVVRPELRRATGSMRTVGRVTGR